jgi:hypothetical protein
MLQRLSFAKTFFIILPWFSFFSLNGQTAEITGRILDAKSSEPLPFANAFIDGTTLGSAADLNGYFVIKNVPIGDHHLVVSFVGYQSSQIKITLMDGEQKKIGIKLLVDEVQLDAVEIKGTRDKDWEKRLGNFKKIFLGTSKNSSLCKIVNPWVLEFAESTTSSETHFTAKASQPLEIDNVALGYRIFYYLKEFRAGATSYIIQGNIRFEQMNTPDKKMADRWTANRDEVYRGSDRHLFKSILEKNIKDAGFQLYTDKSGFEGSSIRSAVFAQELDKSLVKYPIDNIVSPGRKEGEFRITMKGRIEIHNINSTEVRRVYRDVPYKVAWMEVKNSYVYVNANGVPINAESIVTSGYMSASRIAEQLPLDYNVDTQVKVMSDKNPLRTLNATKYQRLQEKIYLHTDKPYYYPGEIVWFKGYLNYRATHLRDSLSQVLYVDLINSASKIITTKILRIDSGRVVGDMLLADTLKAGNYCVRAYTHWMLNYPKNIFMQPIPVLNPSESVEDELLVGPTGSEFPLKFVLNTEKADYKPREKISIEVEIKEMNGNPVKSDLSVAVTDAGQVATVGNSHHIQTDFLFAKLEDIEPSEKKMNFPVEYGITLSGEFRNDRNKPEKTTLVVIQGNMEDMVTAVTDESGKFWLSGFRFSDTTRFHFQAKNKKGKGYGKVRVSSSSIDISENNLPKFNLKVREGRNPQQSKSNYISPQDARLLDEVVITSKKMERTRQGINYGIPDHIIEGDELQGSLSANLVQALQAKIPGLQVVTYYDASGFQRLRIKIRGGGSTFGVFGSFEPLLFVDGMPMMNGNPIADQINAISPSSVERIEVITKANPMLGVTGANGAIAIYTKVKSSSKNSPLSMSESKFQAITIKGFSQPMKFLMPNYQDTSKEHSMPDFRSTLYWNPNLRTNEQGKVVFDFYASDLIGRYRIVLEGVSTEGVPIHYEGFVNVASH